VGESAEELLTNSSRRGPIRYRDNNVTPRKKNDEFGMFVKNCRQVVGTPDRTTSLFLKVFVDSFVGINSFFAVEFVYDNWSPRFGALHVGLAILVKD